MKNPSLRQACLLFCVFTAVQTSRRVCFSPSRRSMATRWFTGVALCLLLAGSHSLFCQVTAPTEPVGTASATQTATITLSSSFTLGSISVVTQGATGLDFNVASGGTCTVGTAYTSGQHCSVNYTFTPTKSGTRYGAIVLFDNTTPTPVAQSTTYLIGTGTGPMTAFYPGTLNTVGSGLISPDGVAVDGSGNVYIADGSKNRVLKVPSTDLTCATAGDCTTVGSGLYDPQGVAVDGAGNVYIDDALNNRVLKETLSGSGYTQSTVANNIINGLFESTDVAVDGSGNVYIADFLNNRVLKETLSGGSYTQSTVGSGLDLPDWVAVDGSGNVYITNLGTSSVLMETLSGGSYTQSTLFSINASGVAVDGNGNVYIADTVNNSVLKETLSGGSYTQSFIVSGLNSIQGVAVDGGGNVYITDSNSSRMLKVDVSDPPALSFASTAEGTISSDSPQTVTLWNLGNAALTLLIPSSGNNPSISANFMLNSSGATACPLIYNTASSAGTLAVGTSCTLPISFAPTAAGSLSGSLVLTDNNLSGSNVTQTITLSGTGTSVSAGTAAQLAFEIAPLSWITPLGGNTGTVTVKVEDASGNFVASSSASVTLTVTGPSSYSQTYTAAASSGMATFNLSGAALTTPGSYTYTATSTGLTTATATEIVTQTVTLLYTAPTEPAGTASGTQTATIVLSSGFTLGSISVLTEGATGLDFNVASGGTCTVGTAYTVGQTCTVNYTFKPTASGVRTGAIVLFDNNTPTPLVQSTTYLTGTGTGPMTEFYPGTQTTVGSGLTGPEDMAVDGGGNVYIADTYNNRVLKETLSSGSYTQSTVGSGLSGPYGVAVDGAGNLYIADSSNDRVLKETLSAGSYTQSIVVGSGLNNPRGAAVDDAGNVYIADTFNNRVLKETLSGGSYTQSIVVGSGLDWPSGVAVDGSGNVFIADTDNLRVLKETLWGGRYSQSNVDVSLYFPEGVAVDGNGNVYVANNGNPYGNYASVSMYVPSSNGLRYGLYSTVGSGLDYPDDVAVDGSGNVYIADTGNSRVLKVDVSDPPTLSFASTPAGTTSSDSPQTVTLWNLGNAALTFPVPSSGNDPSISTNFTLNSSGSTACPLIGSTSSSAGTLAIDASCTLPISFTPTAAGSLSGSLVLTDNNLSGTNVTQTITLNGPATPSAPPTQLAFAVPPTGLVTAGGNAGTVTVDLENASGTLAYGYSASITLTVTGPSSYLQTYTVTASNGVATFNLTSAVLNTIGTYTYTATSGSLTPATVMETVRVARPPVGTASGTQTATIVLSSSFTLGSISVVTQGATGLDFNVASGGTCTVGTSYTSGQSCTVNYTFTPTAPGGRMGAIVLFDNTSPTPVAQSTTYLTGMGTGPMTVFYPGTQSTVGSGLNGPWGVAVDASGNVYIADASNDRVLKEMVSGGSSYAQSVIATSSYLPYDVAVDGAGNVYISEFSSNSGTVLKETLSGSSYTQSVIVGSGLNHPFGVAVDGGGNVYIADSSNDRVLKETLSGGSYTQSTVGSGLNRPYSVAVDGSGNVYIADEGNNRVLKETLSGSSYTQSVIVGSGLNDPYGVAVDGSGNVYIADGGNNRVLMETLSGGSYTQSVIVGSGLSNPEGVAVDGSGNAYIVDEGHNRVLQLNVSTPPSLSFASTLVGATSSDSPQTVTMWNLGNAALTFPVPSSGNNPAIATNFTWNSSGAATCPLIASPASSAGTLALGTSCTLPISFAPTAAGSIIGSLVLTDNTLDGSNVAQTIRLSGTAIALPAAATPNFSPAAGTYTSAQTVYLSDTTSGAAIYYTTDGVTTPTTSSTLYTSAGITVSSTETIQAIAVVSGYNNSAVASAIYTVALGSYSAPTEPVGTASAAQTATILLTSSFTMGLISVVTQGTTGLDFNVASGGTCSVGTAYTAGQSCTVNYTFKPTAPGTRMGAIVLFDNTTPTAVAQSTSYLTGTGTGPLTEFYPATQSTVGNGLDEPTGVAVDGNGNVYIADWLHDRVLKETLSGSSYTPSTILSGSSYLVDVAVDGAGNVYIVDNSNNRVLKETLSSGSYVQSIVVSGLNSPYGVAVDANGNVYIADTSNSRVLKETLSGGSYTQSTVGSGLSHPYNVAVDGNGNVYIADTFNNRVLKETLSSGSYTQSIVASGLSSPSGVTVDGNGNVYISNTNSSSVLMETLLADSYTQTVIATTSNGVNTPAGIAVDGLGNVYVANEIDSNVLELNVSNPPALSFVLTDVGSTSSDSPQTVTVWNLGNAALTLPIPSSGNNPSIAANFTLNSVGSSACPLISSSASSAGSLALGTPCTLPISFTPTSAGSISGSLVLTDNNLNGSNVAQTIHLSGTATGVGTTTTLSSSLNPSAYGQSVTITATVTKTSGTVTPTGTVQFSVDGSAVGSAVTLSGGNATYSSSTLAAGTHSITAVYTPATGSGFTSSSAAALSQVVNKAALTVTAPSPSITYGQTLPTYTATYSGYQNGDTSSVISGSPSLTTSPATPSAAGTYAITGAAGSLSAANYTFTFVNGTLTIGKATLTVTAPSPSITYGQTLPTYTATYSGFQNGDTSSVLSGSPSLTTSPATPSAAGTYAITAAAGSLSASNYIFTFANGTLTINKATLTVTAASPSITYGQTLPTYSATYSGFQNGDTSSVLSGSPSLTTSPATPSAAGSYTITVVVGSLSAANYSFSFVNGTLTINKATSSVSVNSSANPVFMQNPITLTATVSSAAGSPTGTVTFQDGGTPLSQCSAVALTGYTASCTISTLSAASHTITVAYSGDTNFLAATSSAMTETVDDFTLSASGASVTVTAGGTAGYTFTISPGSGTSTFPAAVTLSVSGLPAGATYTLTPSSLAAGAGTTNVTLTIQLPQTVAVEHPPSSAPVKLAPSIAPFALALLLLPVAGRMRKAGRRFNRVLSVLLLLIAGLAAMAGLSGCGSGTGFYGQQQTSYTVTLTATSGALSHSTTVTLTVETIG